MTGSGSARSARVEKEPLLREVLWLVGDLARARKTGALRYLAGFGGQQPPDKRTRQAIQEDLEALGWGQVRVPPGRVDPTFPSGAEPPWGRDEWENATVEEMRDYLDRIGPPWGNQDLLASWVVEAFWIAHEALDRLEAKS